MSKHDITSPWPLSKRLRSRVETRSEVLHPITQLLLNEAADFVDANGTAAKLLEEALNSKASLAQEWEHISDDLSQANETIRALTAERC